MSTPIRGREDDILEPRASHAIFQWPWITVLVEWLRHLEQPDEPAYGPKALQEVSA